MTFQLSMVRLRCTYEATSTVRFPAYAGSTWRGAFGHALRRAVCITREPDCTDCLLWRSCVYSQIFETPAGNEPLLKAIATAPRPYIFRKVSLAVMIGKAFTTAVVRCRHYPRLYRRFRLCPRKCGCAY